jgi:cation:H+ antiporter
MDSLPVIIGLLLGSAGAIYLACEYFVNGVEWAGRKFAVGQQATGSILAAFGTALPESVVTLVAVAFGASAAQKQIGVGAALGGPLVLGTIAYGIVGITLIVCRRVLPKTDAVRAEFKRLSRDQGWFLALFVVKIGVGLIAFAWKPWLGVVFLGAYAAYFWSEIRSKTSDDEGEIGPLKLTPKRAVPSVAAVLIQTLGAMAVIFVASRVFVSQLDTLGPRLGIAPQLLALLLSPIATELPETLNAVIWVRQGKYRMALANISGAMMIQATVPTALGMFFTPWLLDKSLILAGAVTFVAVGAMFLAFRRGMVSRGFLAAMALIYGVFVVALLALRL